MKDFYQLKNNQPLNQEIKDINKIDLKNLYDLYKK